MANNNYPQVTSVTSESLQLKIRQLLPSQQGFGTDLMAQNVIVPIIDLTAAAEQSDVREDLQKAINFGGANAFNIANTTTVIANTVGFWRLNGVVTVNNANSAAEAIITMTDGASSKTVWGVRGGGGTTAPEAIQFDLIFWLTAGESISGTATAGERLYGSARLIADSNGNLIQPTGFDPQ